MKQREYTDIPKEKFEFYKRDDSIHDKEFDTKPIGYFRDAMGRFCRNKSSVVAAIIIFMVVLFAIFVPIFCENNYTAVPTDPMYLQYGKMLPKSTLFGWAGWDGCSKETVNKNDYYSRVAIGVETGMSPIVKVYREDYEDPTSTTKTTYFDIKTDSYLKNGMIYLTLTEADRKSVV